MIKEILKYPDVKLNTRVEESDINKCPMYQVYTDLLDTLQFHGGLGLAATQIGISERVILYKNYARELVILVNPNIVSYKGRMVSKDEGCLSVPGVRANAERAKVIKVEAFNEYGSPIKIKANGTEAIILQHEIDHLNGILFTDRAEKGA